MPAPGRGDRYAAEGRAERRRLTKEEMMANRIAGRSTELCSRGAPCPCAFGQKPTHGTCRGVFVFDVQEGEADGVSLAGTKAIVVDAFDDVWTQGSLELGLILDANASEEQHEALRRILTGELGGDAAGLAALVGDFRGVEVAPIEHRFDTGRPRCAPAPPSRAPAR